jgi:copper chaperone
MTSQDFEVKTMSCGHCVRAVTQAIQEIDPGAGVEIDLATGKVSVASERSRKELAQAIREAGYETAA